MAGFADLTSFKGLGLEFDPSQEALRSDAPRNGEPGMSYVSQDAAYEVVVAEAAGDLGTAPTPQIAQNGSRVWRGQIG
jgi:hypothetical protein